ncbi:MAG TPA: NADP-dependent phosphogluconate dehydrogenase [Deltaproteobacteria bacterium]|jgi:6-phosphogluconate dehydrogenase|nr:NADP-dependent phosphogluconate dehydrogenase [Deltaproteobacteria bacterium]HOI07681.1 NADP-dependent phosphogluconate dehydrogenase [Deltaproteobacteria bacterium]
MAGMEVGMIGLGRMGANFSLQALEKGIRVVGYSRGVNENDLVAKGLVLVPSIEDFRRELLPPRIILLYIPAGPAVDTILGQLIGVLDRGDIIADGGNSYWGDSIERGKRLKEHVISFVDLGTSGGMEGARHGACFMAGGEKEAIERIRPLLTTLSVPGGFVHTGPIGTGHFTKLVHNGIEFGMLQAIAEGIDLLAHFHEKLDIPAVLSAWKNGSVIRSWLIELMERQLREQGGMENIPPYVEDTGEVNWLISDAIQMELPIPVIIMSVMRLFASRDKDGVWARAIAMMRHGFGGHAFGSDPLTANERRRGRVGCIYRTGQEVKSEL